MEEDALLIAASWIFVICLSFNLYDIHQLRNGVWITKFLTYHFLCIFCVSSPILKFAVDHDTHMICMTMLCLPNRRLKQTFVLHPSYII